MNKKNYIELLLKTKLFRMFSKEDLECYINHNNTIVKEFQRNSLISFHGECCDTLNIILHGEVGIEKIDEDGNFLTIITFKTYESFGENLVFGAKNTYPFSVVAKENCTILSIKKEIILDLLSTNKEFLLAFMQKISINSLFVGNRMLNLTGKSLREKILDYLKEEQILQDSNKIILKITKKELSHKLSVQRPSLSRELKKMEQDGLIEFDNKSITILQDQ